MALAVLLTAAIGLAGPGTLLPVRDLPPATRAELTRQVVRAKIADPVAFERLDDARNQVAMLDARKRGPLAPITPLLKTLGPRALLPMLQQAALSAPPRGPLSPSAWLAWRLGLIEAIGALRDPRAEPVLLALFEARLGQRRLDRAAAVAYAKLGTEPVALRLIRAGRRGTAERNHALHALGHCRLQSSAAFLARQLGSRPTETEAKVLARALGNVGSAWAWRTPVIAASGEEQAVRYTAARALVAAYPEQGEAVRPTIAKAVLVVNHPDTQAFIRAEQQRASPASRLVLEELRLRFARSPLRR
jgi:HEAT repeat protein